MQPHNSPGHRPTDSNHSGMHLHTTTPPKPLCYRTALPRCPINVHAATLAICLASLLINLHTKTIATTAPLRHQSTLAQLAPALTSDAVEKPFVDNQNPIRSMGSRFRAQESAENVRRYLWILIAPLAAAAGLIAFVHFRESKDEPRSAPDRLLRELGHEHDLSSLELRTLQHMAELIGVKHPAALMVRPDRFDEALQIVRQTPDQRRHDGACQLRERLFGITQDDLGADHSDGKENAEQELRRSTD